MNTADTTIWGAELAPWQLMISIALAIYAVSKIATWWPARHRLGLWHGAAYLFAWLGMDPQPFFMRGEPSLPTLKNTLGAGNNLVIGLVCITFAATASLDLRFAGLIGLMGFVLVLHFGLFHLLALGWRRVGFAVHPIMNRPIAATSLADFWSRRWNLAFRDLAHRFVFQPLAKHTGSQGAMVAVFAVSGIVHDIVISLPAGGGYGLPTLYFLLQAAGLSMQRTRLARQLGLASGVLGWHVTALIVVGPVQWLFHDAFLVRVMLPLVKTLHTALFI